MSKRSRNRDSKPKSEFSDDDGDDVHIIDDDGDKQPRYDRIHINLNPGENIPDSQALLKMTHLLCDAFKIKNYDPYFSIETINSFPGVINNDLLENDRLQMSQKHMQCYQILFNGMHLVIKIRLACIRWKPPDEGLGSPLCLVVFIETPFPEQIELHNKLNFTDLFKVNSIFGTGFSIGCNREHPLPVRSNGQKRGALELIVRLTDIIIQYPQRRPIQPGHGAGNWVPDLSAVARREREGHSSDPPIRGKLFKFGAPPDYNTKG